MQNLTEERARELSEQWQGRHIAVIGDLMLDRYFWGAVQRVSPEAPVPVVDIEDESFHLGGASNVASNLKSLGTTPLMLGVIGDDNSGTQLLNLVRDSEMDTSGIVVDADRPTTVKTRIIGNNQHIARLDREEKHDISSESVAKLLGVLEHYTEILGGIIFQDYNKGVITPELISQVIVYARDNHIPVFVDPKYNNFFEFKGATLFKPNRKETADALDRKISSEEEVLEAGRELLERLESEYVLVTLSQKGMMLFEDNGEVNSVPAKARHVSDVSGAGDTVIATIAAAVCGGASMREAATLANIAAGVVCQEPGIVSIETPQLLQAVAKDK